MPTTPTPIVGYMYRADLYCPACIVAQLPGDVITPAARDMAAEDVLDQVAAYVDRDRDDEYSFDSDEFPKVVTPQQVTAEDVCGNCHEPLDPID